MDNATHVTTKLDATDATSTKPERLNFSSAGAVRRKHAAPAAASSPDPTVVGSHTHLIERIAGNPPVGLNPFWVVDADDLNERAAHLRALMIAVSDYVRVAIRDVEAHSNTVDSRYIIGCLDDLTAEIAGALENAADDLQAA